MKRVFYIVLGCIGVGLGALGAVLPVLPSFPFLMLAAWSFAKSSKRLDAWFRGTRLYKNNLADFAAGRGMTKKTKMRIMLTVTALMSIGFGIMGSRGIYAGCITLACVWVGHILYFVFGVKTLRKEGEAA